MSDFSLELLANSLDKVLEYFQTTGQTSLLPSSYKKVAERERYEVWKYTSNGSFAIRGVLGNIAVGLSEGKRTIYISTTGINGEYDTIIPFNNTSFPNLISSGTSYVETLFVLPWTRNRTNAQGGNQWRLVVVSSTGQVYHNFPSRAIDSDGAEVDGDIARFDESVIWDLPERKYPSKNPLASGAEYYFPCLPDSCYEHYPLLNTDANFIDTYGNGGFGLSKTVKGNTYPRFYIPKRISSCVPLFPMGGYEPGDKITLVGTYRTNNNAGIGARIGVFATDDGGRQWYCKYEFAEAGSYPNWGNDIDTTNIATAYTADSFQVVKKSNVYPSALDKEPTTKFTIGDPVVISDISRANPAVVTTATAHGLLTGNIVAIQDNPGSAETSPDWDWMRNDTLCETSGGNGVTFKIEKVDDTSFKLHEEVHSPFNNLAARHIHHINRIKDGWIMGTGEQYPEGWLFYIPTKAADSFALLLATDKLDFHRLNSAQEGIQRSLGCIMLDDTDNTIVFASDISNLTRPNIAVPDGRTFEVMRSSTGIFKGKLVDVDDFEKFMPIFEAKEVAYFFKEIQGTTWIYCGQRGELAISFNKGVTWSAVDLDAVAQYYYGENNQCIVISDFIIVFK